VVVNPAAGPIRLRDFDTGPLGDVLRRGGQRSGWAQRHALPPRTAKGIAFYFSRAGCFAEVAQVTVPPSGDIKLDHVWIVADFGSQIINPSGAVNQVQGAALDVIGAALGQAITPERGRVVQSNFDSTRPLRIGQVPPVDVEFLISDHPPTGLGEPALPPVVPALCNAIFAATGKRIRAPPIDADELKACGSAASVAARRAGARASVRGLLPSARPACRLAPRSRPLGAPGGNARVTIAARPRKKIRARQKNSCIASSTRLIRDCPISHVPVAACRLVGIRTRGRTAARSEAETQSQGTPTPTARVSAA
jgi:hypothetical protein